MPNKPPTDGAVLLDRQPESERIAEGDLAYHVRLAAQAQWARSVMARVQQIDAAAVLWAEHLTETYGLKPGDSVGEEGQITRGGADV